MKKLLLKPMLLAFAFCVTAIVAAAAYGTAGGGFTATLFTRDTMTDPVHLNGDRIKFQTKDASDFASQTITYEPGAFSGWHQHPGLVLVMVKSGQVTRYLAPDCHSISYSEGQAFVETADDPVMQIRNEGVTNAVLYVAYIVPKGSPLRLDTAAPTCAS